MTKGEVIQRIIARLPYPDQIRDLEVEYSETTIFFNWRGRSFRVGNALDVNEVQGDLLVGSDEAILMERLLTLTV